MHVLVSCCFFVVRKVQLECWLVWDILLSSKSKSYNTKVVDHSVFYIMSKFHIF
jgi:hypothetical protein